MARKKTQAVALPTDLSEQKVVDQLFNEYQVARRNQEPETADFEAVLDMLECKRTEREYEWMSDVFVPEYPSIHLTEASQWANQYFQSRDFVEVYLTGDKPTDKVQAQMVKKYINTQLNQKELYHFIKYMRLRGINSTRGVSYALCKWERETKAEKFPKIVKKEVIDPETGLTQFQDDIEQEEKEVITVDRFNYEPLDPRFVFTDSKYSYSLQDKEYIIIWDEVSYEDLVLQAKSKGYINLDKVRELTAPVKTEAAKKSSEAVEPDERPDKAVFKKFDRLLRLGKVWAVVTSRTEDGYPLTTKPGYDELGQLKNSAELIESIVEEIFAGDKKILIRFQPTPYRTSKGSPYRPVIRSLCYVHPTKDVGMSDGKYARELQVAINDTVNMSNDRTKLATMPTFKGQANAVQDNDQIYFEPEHVIPLPNLADLEEFQIKDDIRGAMEQTSLFISKMQQVQAVYPTTMGELPGQASTTATAVANTTERGNSRANYKSLTWEFTFFSEFYWMMLQMAYQFMHPDTAVKLWGDAQARIFDPDADYSYTPVSSNIEMEYNKDRKIQRYDQMLGRIANIPNPAIIPLLAHIIGQMCILMGSEYQDIAQLVQTLAQTPNTPEGPGTETPADAQAPPTSNQRGMPMSIAEQGARGI
jgi:hypothetical protein